jgi:site-specific recombinase XerD
MPKLINRTPKYRHHKATGQAVVTLTGRDFYLGPWQSAKSKREYARLISQWLAAGSVLIEATAHSLTIEELLAAFWRHARAYYVDTDGKSTTEQGNFRTLIKRFRKAYGETLVRDFGPLKLKAFRQSLIDSGLARGNINHHINRLRHIFKWGVGNELVTAGVVESLRCVDGLRYGKSEARETEPIRPVPDAFVDAVLPHVSPQVRAMIELQRLTGMRSGEVCHMRTADINTAVTVWTYTPKRHKTQYRGHIRTVYMGPRAQQVIKPWLRTELDEHLFQPSEAEVWRREQRHAKRKTPLSCGNRPGTNRRATPRWMPGICYTPRSYGKAIQYACEIAFGMPAELRKGQSDETEAQRRERYKLATEWRRQHCWHPHQLRHNAATLFRREHGLEVARILLGHKNMVVTQIYAEGDQQRAIEVMSRVG